MNTQLPPAVRHLCARYRTQADSTRRSSHEMHDLRSLSQRLLLSPEETLDQVASGNLLSLDSRNGKHMFSSRTLDVMRNRVVDFIAGEIVEEMTARGASEDRICFALNRAFQKQFDLSRGRGENIVEFAQTPADDDDDDGLYGAAKRAAAIAGAGALGYGAYKGYQYLKGQNNGNGTALPGPSGGSGPQSGGGGPRTPRDPNSSAEGIDVGSGNGSHPTAPSISRAITTASPTTPKLTAGTGIIDPLSQAVTNGRKAIAKRGSAIWQALRGIPLE